MTVADDLATLRDYRPDDSRGFSQRRFDAALDRVEAEIALLRAQRAAYQRAMDTWEAREQRQHDRAEAAEAEIARLRDGLREIAERPFTAALDAREMQGQARALLENEQ